MLNLKAIIPAMTGQILLRGLIVLLFNSTLGAQQTSGATSVDQQTIQLLLQRIDQLEARVAQLEANEGATALKNALPPSKAADSATSRETDTNPARHNALSQSLASLHAIAPLAGESEQAPSENAMNDRMDLSKTLMRIRGFGDVSFHGDTQPGDNTSFSMGELDLFITSDMSDRFKFLSEVVFEAGPDNIYGVQVGPENSFDVDIERYLLQYSYNDYFNLAIGRGHTAIGYYNNAYHHSSWMQTTTERPFLFEFEDRGGILPIHIVGASASGRVPSGSLGLHYVAEIGNGRESRNPLEDEPVQNEISDRNGKAFNLELFARPEAWQGFQSGLSFYRDRLLPTGSPKIAESILAAHALLIRPKYEWLNEALMDRHAISGTPYAFNTPGFYSQVSKQFGSYRPYFRYEYLNVSRNEPVFPDVALRHGPIAGLRYDPNESVAVKFEYQYTFLRNQQGVHGLTGQVGFTF